MNDDELERLRRETEHGTRIADQSPQARDPDALVDALVENLDAIASGEKSKTFSARDDALMALFWTLDDNEAHRADLGERLEAAANVEVDAGFDRSTLVRLAVRVGLSEAAPEYLDALREAAGEHARRKL